MEMAQLASRYPPSFDFFEDHVSFPPPMLSRRTSSNTISMDMVMSPIPKPSFVSRSTGSPGKRDRGPEYDSCLQGPPSKRVEPMCCTPVSVGSSTDQIGCDDVESMCVVTPGPCLGTPVSGTARCPIAQQIGICFGVQSKIGPRKCNEDAHACLFSQEPDQEPHAFFAVFDGHGGAGAAEHCRDHLHSNIMKSVHYPHMLELAISDGFLRTDAQILADAARSAAKKESDVGAAAVVMLAKQRQLILAHVGDCRAILVRKEGAEPPFVELTADHAVPRLSDEMVELVEKLGHARAHAAADAVAQAHGGGGLLHGMEGAVGEGCAMRGMRRMSGLGASRDGVAGMEGIDGTQPYVEKLSSLQCELAAGGSPLSEDEARELARELERVVVAGGQVRPGYVNVGENNLPMTRAFGNLRLKVASGRDWRSASVVEQIVTALPQVLVRPRDADDVAVVLASDGLFGTVMSSERVATMAREKLLTCGHTHDAEGMAARYLAEEGAKLGEDNVSVVVVTLEAPPPESPPRHAHASHVALPQGTAQRIAHGMQPFAQACMQPFMQPCKQPFMQPCMQTGMATGMMPSMVPGMRCAAPPLPSFAFGDDGSTERHSVSTERCSVETERFSGNFDDKLRIPFGQAYPVPDAPIAIATKRRSPNRSILKECSDAVLAETSY